MDGNLDLDITDIVLLEEFPLLQVMMGKVTGTAAIGLCCLARNTEVSDEFLALGHLLFIKTEYLAGVCQLKGKAHIGSTYHVTPP